VIFFKISLKYCITFQEQRQRVFLFQDKGHRSKFMV